MRRKFFTKQNNMITQRQVQPVDGQKGCWHIAIRSLRRKIKAALLLSGGILAAGHAAQAQAPTITYPAAAQDITRAYSQSNLTVKLVFNGACTGATTVKVALPASVTYVAGTVAKTSGTAGLSISEGSIADLSNPVFNIGGSIATGSDITFTIARSAACGSLATAKDSVYVFTSGGCSNGSETANTVNTYNLLSPSLAITPPPALTNAVVGTTATRTTTVTNGGNGVLDTLRYYVVYTAGGIINTSGTNTITANGVAFTPSSTNGDTLFYKIYGASLFGGDNLLSNGETVTITEPIKVVKCNTATTYGAGWGKTKATQCQVATGTSAVTMATGVTNLGIVTSDVTLVGACASAPGLSKSVFTNNGTGGNAGAMYNVIANLGFIDNSQILFVSSNGEYLSNFTFGAAPGTGTALVVDTLGTAYTSNASVRARLSQFTTDPDGAGVGLDDLDGDGQYDDLAPGKSFTIFFYRNYKTSTLCPRASYAHFVGATATYNDMCGTLATSLPSNGVGGQRTLYTVPNRDINTVPQIFNGVPFTVTISHYSAMITAVNQSVDSMELTLTLPAGVTYVPGTFYFRGFARPDAANVTVSGSTVQFRTKLNGTNNLWYQDDFTFDLVYDCSGGSLVNLSWEMDYVNTRSCGDIVERLYCGSKTIPAVCPASCPGGLANIFTKAERTSLGFTDATLATRINPGSIPAVQLATVLPYDTVVVTNSAQQSSVAYSNVHFNFELDKVSGQNTLVFISGTYNHKAAGTGTITTVAMPAPTDLSTATHTQWDWNLTGLGGLPATLSAGDSVWVAVTYLVSNAASGQLYGIIPTYAPNANSYFYSNDASAVRQYCLNLVPLIRFVGYANYGTGYWGGGPNTLVGCGAASPRASYYNGYGVNYRIFNNEFRPSHRVDSVVIILPPGVEYDASATPTINYTRWADVYNQSVATFNIGAPVINGQRLTFINPGNWPLNDVGANGSQSDSRITYSLKSTCEAGNTTGPLPLLQQYYGKTYYYDNTTVPMTVTTAYAIGASFFGIDGSKRPSVAVQNNTGVVQGVQPQQYWDVQVANPSTQTAPYLWLALEKAAASGITIDSVVLKPSNLVLTTASTYGTGNKWYQVSAAGLTTGSTQQARVYFKYTNCTPDSILLKAGWNCTGYPNADPTAYACTAAQTYLKVVPQPSQVQLSVARQPGGGSSINLCTTDSTLLIVNSAQAANLVSPYVTFYPPAGVTPASTIQVEYPLGSGNYQPATVTSIGGGGYKIDLSAHTAIGSNGMLGTASSNPAFTPLGGDRQAKIKLDFTTSCGFVSGSSFNFNAYGNMPCGAAATGNGVSASTSALNITGATAAGSAGVLMSFGAATAVSCGTNISFSQTITPTGMPSAAGDTMVYTLPLGMAYAGNLTTGFTATVSGQIVKVAMPAGVAAATPINFSFDVTAAGGGCGSGSVSAAYQRSIAPLSCGGTPCASSSAVIANGASPVIAMNKPDLSITAVTKTSGAFVPGGTVNVNVTVANSGTVDAPAATYIVEVFCGSSSIPFATDYFPSAITAGSNATAAMTFTIPAGGSSCTVGATTTYKILPVTALGTSQCICSATTFTPLMVLPVTFTSTDATADNCAVDVKWSYELSNAWTLQQFVVERSSDNTNFTAVATLAATAVHYTDVVPASGNWYYRIKAVEVNGNITYSKTVVVKASSCQGTGLKVYPNPAHGQLQIVLQGNSNTNNYQLIDAIGRIIQNGSLRSNTNNTINISKIASGIYILKVWMDGVVQTKQVHIVP
ncbi:T9SS type A sorting domain-containing protein [Ferruginibacter sp.]